MHAVATKLGETAQTAETHMETGVVRHAEGRLLVDAESGRLRAERAASCLIEPGEGDTVLVAVDRHGRAWVLAVLDRASDGPTELAVEGDLRVKVNSGRFTVGAEGIDLVSTEDTRVASKRLDVHATEGAAYFDKLTYLGRLVHIDAESVKSFVGLVDQVFDRLSSRVKRSYRFIEELDMTRAKQIDLRAEDNVHVRGHNTIMSAELLVKVDGEQIHLG